jgi:putative two-component system response regulator
MNIYVPIILLTSDCTNETEIKGFQHGVIDYIKKPVFKESLNFRIKNYISIIENTCRLERNLEKTEHKVKSLENKIVSGMQIVTDLRDNETGMHIQRIGILSRIVSEQLKATKYLCITDEFIDKIEKAAPFHDIGKISIPDNILKKPGKLTDEEFEIMKTHTIKGQEAIRKLIELNEDSFLVMAEEIALYHHEKWDGSGYPFKIKGNQIPLSARIISVVDAYDAMTSKRIYKTEIPHEEAIQILIKESNKHFDPTIVKAFIEISNTIQTKLASWHDLN